MAKKAMANAAAAGIGSAPVPRAAKPSTKKTKNGVSDVVEGVVETIETTPEAPAITAQDAHHQIAKIAYGYWSSRGYQGGSQAEDWLRAEQEYLHGKSMSATR